jgi:hypothetical protein
MNLYHKDIYFPTVALNSCMLLDYSRHALEQSSRHGHTISLPAYVDLRKVDVVEVGIEGGKVVHALVRVPYNEREDLVMAICVCKRLVKTVWLNNKNDQHGTLDTSRYETC